MGLQRVNDFRGVNHSEPAVLTDSEQQAISEIEYQSADSASIDD